MKCGSVRRGWLGTDRWRCLCECVCQRQARVCDLAQWWQGDNPGWSCWTVWWMLLHNREWGGTIKPSPPITSPAACRKPPGKRSLCSQPPLQQRTHKDTHYTHTFNQSASHVLIHVGFKHQTLTNISKPNEHRKWQWKLSLLIATCN